jgi:hypothetical protein
MLGYILNIRSRGSPVRERDKFLSVVKSYFIPSMNYKLGVGLFIPLNININININIIKNQISRISRISKIK